MVVIDMYYKNVLTTRASVFISFGPPTPASFMQSDTDYTRRENISIELLKLIGFSPTTQKRGGVHGGLQLLHGEMNTNFSARLSSQSQPTEMYTCTCVHVQNRRQSLLRQQIHSIIASSSSSVSGGLRGDIGGGVGGGVERPGNQERHQQCSMPSSCKCRAATVSAVTCDPGFASMRDSNSLTPRS